MKKVRIDTIPKNHKTIMIVMIMIDPKTNKPRPVYLEPEIVVSPFELF